VNLCKLIVADYAAVIADFSKLGMPKQPDFAFDILTDVAIAYALLQDFDSSTRTLSRLKVLRESLDFLEYHSVWESRLVELIAMCACGHWSQARRLSAAQARTPASLEPITDLLTRLCQGPPFVAVRDELQNFLGAPYIGLAALLMQRVIANEASFRPKPALTPTESEVLGLLALGRTNKEIAALRSRSIETVKRQVVSLYKKLGVENRTGAIAIARERGLL
jgi:DNA-binding CsgD family transcriptional regulator